MTSAAQLEELALLFRQLHVVTSSGVPLTRGLEAVARSQWKGDLGAAVQGVLSLVLRGERLSTAFGRWPHCFPLEAIGLLRVGEATGGLVVVLARLADLLERRALQRRRLQAALTYPFFVLSISVLLVAGLLVFFLPRMTEVLASLGQAPPWLLVQGARLLGDPLTLVTALEVAAVAAFVGFRWLRTLPGRRWRDEQALRLPWARGLLLAGFQAQLAYSLSLMLACGLAIQDALELLAQTLDFGPLADALRTARARLLHGASLGQALRQEELISPMLVSMVEVGEESGKLPALLERGHELLAEELRLRVETATSLLEPCVTLGLGVLIGAVALGFYYPLMQVLRQL